MTNPIGFIKIHRKLLEWEWYSDTNTFRLFMHLLMTANYENKNWRGIDIKRGQVLIGRLELAKSTTLSQQQVRTALNKLKSTNEITIRSTNRFSIIELVNYNLYQDNSKQDNQPHNQPATQQATNKQPTDNQQITTTKETKEIKEVKNKEKVFFDLPDFIDVEIWNKFVKHRITKKAAITQDSSEVIIKKLCKWEASKAGNGNQALEDCIAGNWQGLFEPKESNFNKPKSNLGWLNK